MGVMMVTLDTIRYEMEKKLQNDKDLQCVEVSADSLDAALADAAIQLDSRVANLEYEVLEKGSNGFLGLMKKHWTIRVYENEEIQHQKKQKKQEEASVFAFSEFAYNASGSPSRRGANSCGTFKPLTFSTPLMISNTEFGVPVPRL